MFQNLYRILEQNASPEGKQWLDDFLARQKEEFNQRQLYYAFSGATRRFPKEALTVSDDDRAVLEAAVSGFQVDGWTVDRLVRVMLLCFLAEQTPGNFHDAWEALLLSADLREQVAMYSALAILPDSRELILWARDGLRSNIVDVFDSIALENPYPAAHFDDAGWNQMILKCLFINRPLYRVEKIDERANAELAEALSYLAHERWAAGRYVSPELWRSCSGFVNDQIAEDVRRVAADPDPRQKEAAALIVVANSPGSLDDLKPGLEAELARIEDGTLTWDSLGMALAAASN